MDKIEQSRLQKELLEKEGVDSTYKSLLNDEILGYGLRVEITHPR